MGDDLTDPQLRSGFPRDIAPSWFAWKDGFADKGFRFNIDYLAPGQSSNADLGEGQAAAESSGFTATGKQPNAAL